MLGFENISIHNGWSISLIGITIVFSGLAALSFVISQLHKILDLWENRQKHINSWSKRKKADEAAVSSIPEITFPPDMKESIRQYKILIDRLGEPFSLPELLSLAEKCGMEHPHSEVNKLIISEIIVPDGKGYYESRFK